jgi:hypothetical protein
MTADEFRGIALRLPEAVEIGHMGHPDFRVGKKIFATLGYPDDDHGMIKLMPGQQALFIESHPKVFSPAKGKWGLGGSTLVALKSARPRAVREAMAMAWRLVAPPRLLEALS